MTAQVQLITAADGVRLALHRIGPRDGAPVLLLPGTFSNHTFWLGTRGIGFARELASAGFEAITLDFRGHGHSDRPGSADRWHFDDWVRQDTPAVLDAVIREGRQPFVIGHSAGGAAALACLAAHPELAQRVSGLVTVATPGPWLEPWRQLAAKGIRLISRVLGRFPARLLRIGPEDELPDVMRQWMSWNLAGRWTGDDGIDYAVGMQRLMLPVLAMAAQGDRTFATPAACRGLFDLIGSHDKSFQLCGRGAGFSEDFDHVAIVIGRAARSEVWPLILDWLKTREAMRRSAAAG